MTPNDRREELSRVASARAALARRRTNELVEEISRWRKSEPVSTTLHLKDAPDYGWYIEIDEVDPMPPLEDWGIQFGEIVHHLRSTLNTTLARIAQREGVSPSSRLQYPIANTSGAWRRALRGGQLKGIPERVIRSIYACQPFLQARRSRTNPKDNTLSVLAWLNNSDKHRLELAGELGASWVEHQALITNTNGETLLVTPSVETDFMLLPGRRMIDANSSPHVVAALHHASLDMRIEVLVRDHCEKHTPVEQLLKEVWDAFQQAQMVMITSWADEQIDLDLFAGASDFKPGSAFGEAAVDSINGPGAWKNDLLRRDLGSG